ncbi:MAG: UDP-N-acetylmuramate dehydrogenase [Proteobacteria bacterium]|nr:UDP-N-acetylmuramate dehydrogenase [Pseudomonadota bacterium]
MIQEHFSLKPYNTFGIDAKATFFCEIDSIERLQYILTHDQLVHLPKLILGEGSNILFTQDFPGIVCRMKIKGIEQVEEDSEHIWIKAGAGENWHNFVLYCLANQYAGVENLSLIPGTVGAAPMQNIGAYGVELTQVFEKLTALRIEDGAIQSFTHQDCQFGYRESVFKNIFKNKFIITDVTLRLNKKPQFHLEYGALKQMLNPNQELTIKKISDAVIEIRTQKLPNPKIIGNAGSFFKNPVVGSQKLEEIKSVYPDVPHHLTADNHYKLAAAWLIEQCHWKGYREKNIGVHKHHALVLVNYGGGSGKAIFQLAKNIQHSVMEKFGVELLAEVNII